MYSQPSRIVSAVAFSFRQYPAMTFSPRTTISPCDPAGSRALLVADPDLEVGNQAPDEPSLWRAGVFAEITGEASVSPYPWYIGMPMA